MMIYLGADHRGFNLKEKIKTWLKEWGYDFQDLGSEGYDKDDDYPDVAIKLGEKVVADNTKGILICGSGVGACVAANKVKGVRAGTCLLDKQSVMGRNDDDMNIVCLNADMVPEEDNQQIIRSFIYTPFSSEERFIRRINKIKTYEAKVGS